jgi:glucose/arabinose dehydrogenase
MRRGSRLRGVRSAGLAAVRIAAGWSAALLLVACGGGGGGGGGSESVATPAPSSRATPSPARTAPPTPTPPAASPTPATFPALRLTPIASGLDQPLFVGSAPDGSPRLYVVEQTGRIRIVADGAVSATPFLDLSGVVSCCGERGLLGLAFHPDYAANGRFFVNYTGRDGNSVIEEYARSSGDPTAADPQPVRTFFVVEQPFPNHNGGMLAFAPDGFLYVGLGDGGGAGDPSGNGQSITTKLGKILRIDVDRYPTPPPGNLTGGDPDIWDYGLRNPWRFSFDRATGDLYIGDVGQDRYEEVDVEPSGQGRRNYGWRITEGLHCFDPPGGCDLSGITLPVVEYGHDAGCSITGGYVYRGTSIPGLTGYYLYGDYCSGRVWTLTWSAGVVANQAEITDNLDPDKLLTSITSFGEDSAGELYVVVGEGAVLRIDAR